MAWLEQSQTCGFDVFHVFDTVPLIPFQPHSLHPSTPPPFHPFLLSLSFHSTHPPMLLSFFMERRSEGGGRHYVECVGGGIAGGQVCFVFHCSLEEREREVERRERGVWPMPWLNGTMEFPPSLPWPGPSHLSYWAIKPYTGKSSNRYFYLLLELYNFYLLLYRERAKGREREEIELRLTVYWQALWVNPEHRTLNQTVEYYHRYLFIATCSSLPVGRLRIRYVWRWSCSLGSNGVGVLVRGHKHLDNICFAYIHAQRRKGNENGVFIHRQIFRIHAKYNHSDPLQINECFTNTSISTCWSSLYTHRRAHSIVS